MIQGQNTGAADILPSPQTRDHGIEDQGTADLNDVWLCGAARPGPNPRERRRFMETRDWMHTDIVRPVWIEALPMRQSADGDYVQCTGRLEQTVGLLDKVPWIFGHRLFEAIAAPWSTVPRRYDDDDVKLARQFVQRGRPRPDLTSVKDAPTVGQGNNENPTSEALVQRSDRFAHLRRNK